MSASPRREVSHLFQGILSVIDYYRPWPISLPILVSMFEITPLCLMSSMASMSALPFMGDIIQRQGPFPIFRDVCSDLRLAEINMAAAPRQPARALAVSTQHAPAPSSYPGTDSNSDYKQNRHDNKKNGDRALGPMPSKSTWEGAPPQWPNATPPRWQPAYGTFQAYWATPQGRAPRAAGPPRPQAHYASSPMLPGPPPPLAPLPRAPQQPPGFAGPPTGQMAPPSWISHPGGFLWDPAILDSSYITMTLQQPPTSEWHMDTGAKTHMTSNSINLCVSHPPSPSAPSSIIVADGSIILLTRVLDPWSFLLLGVLFT